MPWAAPWNGFGQTAMPTPKVAIVAALEREVWPLVKDWPVSHREHEGRWLKFLACKVISDANDSRMPPIGRFIGDDGRFHALKFVVYVAFRPRLWASVGQLARDSVLAAGKLCEALSAVTTEAHAQAVSSDPRAAANLKT